MGDFVEQGTGADGGGEGIGVEEGGCDVYMRTEVGLDEVGVEVREEGGEGSVEAGLQREDGGVSLEGVVVKPLPASDTELEEAESFAWGRGGSDSGSGGGGGCGGSGGRPVEDMGERDVG